METQHYRDRPPDAVDEHGFTPLMWAAWLGDLECVEALLAQGADPNGRPRGDATALCWAMETNCKEEMVRALLLAGAEINPLSRSEFPTLLRAVINTNVSIIRLLLQAGADPNVHYDTGDPSTVKQDGTTPLIAAARRGEVVIASLLLEAGADRHARDRTGRTALMRAIEWGTTEVVDLLTEI